MNSELYEKEAPILSREDAIAILNTPNGNNTMILAIVSLLRIIAEIISIMYSVKLAKAFGKGTGFAIGLIFLSPIFILILGLGDSTYHGAQK